MTYHPDARTLRRVSLFIDWLKTLFDAKRYPWFGDEFIHPRDLLGEGPTDGIIPAIVKLPLRRRRGAR
jgi:hypothetical protein